MDSFTSTPFTPTPLEASCVKVHDDDPGNKAIHDEAGNCGEDMLALSHFTGEQRAR